MYVATGAEMRRIDQSAINDFLVPEIVLMENAAASFVETLKKTVEDLSRKKVLILAGCGNNGGDGFVMARVAAKEGVQVRVLLAEGEPKTADAKTNLARLAETAAEVVRDTEQAAFGADAVVDALYGTGFHGELRPGGAAACALMGRERERGAFVLALDLPSGVSADSGEVAEGAVQADATVTFDCTKPLHFAKASKPLCGALVCADIGIGKALGEHET